MFQVPAQSFTAKRLTDEEEAAADAADAAAAAAADAGRRRGLNLGAALNGTANEEMRLQT